MTLKNGSLSFADMKTATPFFSDFFNTDCLVVEGVPHFSITGATKTLYGNTGGESLRSLRAQLVKTSGTTTRCSATDLSDLPGISPVRVEVPNMPAKEGMAMNQDTFKSLLKLYRGKDTKAGRYADEITDKLIGVSLDLILRKEAGLMHEEAAKESRCPQAVHPWSRSRLTLPKLPVWKSPVAATDLDDCPGILPVCSGRRCPGRIVPALQWISAI